MKEVTLCLSQPSQIWGLQRRAGVSLLASTMKVPICSTPMIMHISRFCTLWFPSLKAWRPTSFQLQIIRENKPACKWILKVEGGRCHLNSPPPTLRFLQLGCHVILQSCRHPHIDIAALSRRWKQHPNRITEHDKWKQKIRGCMSTQLTDSKAEFNFQTS